MNMKLIIFCGLFILFSLISVSEEKSAEKGNSGTSTSEQLGPVNNEQEKAPAYRSFDIMLQGQLYGLSGGSWKKQEEGLRKTKKRYDSFLGLGAGDYEPQTNTYEPGKTWISPSVPPTVPPAETNTVANESEPADETTPAKNSNEEIINKEVYKKTPAGQISDQRNLGRKYDSYYRRQKAREEEEEEKLKNDTRRSNQYRQNKRLLRKRR